MEDLLIQSISFLWLLFMGPKTVSQLIRAIVHDRGWNTTWEDLLTAVSAFALFIKGLPNFAV